MESKPIRISADIVKRIDDLRHSSQSRTEWVNRVLLRHVVIAETCEQQGLILE